MDYLERSAEQRKIIWFKVSNRYSLVELPAYEVITRLMRSVPHGEISKWCSEYYTLPPAEARRFVDEIADSVAQQATPAATDIAFAENENSISFPPDFYSQRFYKAGNIVIAVDYQCEDLEYMIHPKFAHLEIATNASRDYHFSVFMQKQDFVLSIDEQMIGRWKRDDSHYFTGKFSMELLNRMYAKTDADWIGVFHASAISRNDRCIMFLGISGSGKSTIAAILVAAGFGLVADDFVPLGAASVEVFSFPAAVSVKKKAVDVLSSQFPQLLDAKEYTYPGVGKTVRYLAPHITNGNIENGFPCKALVYVNYQPDSGLVVEKMPGDEAFMQLVPDSWLSPLEANASQFLDWFLALPCYRLTYSDNEKMVVAVHELFDHE